MGSDDKLGSDVLDFEQTGLGHIGFNFFFSLLFPHFSFLFLPSSVFFLLPFVPTRNAQIFTATASFSPSFSNHHHNSSTFSFSSRPFHPQTSSSVPSSHPICMNSSSTTMAEEVVATCSNPGCDLPGTKQCSACKTTPYCGPICQTADWAHHKEECPGHLRKLGTAHLEKAAVFHGQQNWQQTLRYADLALTKLKQLKDRRLETVEILDNAFALKSDALQRMDRHKEALECAKEHYTLWAMNHMRNPGMFDAAFGLIQSCIHNREFEDAALYAHTAHEMVANDADGIIPSDQRQKLLARGSYWLSQATLFLAQAGGIPPAEMQKAGEEAIALARKALEIHTQLHGTESAEVAMDTTTLAGALNCFNDVDDDEILRLHEQANAITIRLEGSSSVNVAVGKSNLGNAYYNRTTRACAANDLDRCVANLELALPHYREAARLYRENNHVDKADKALRNVVQTEEDIRKFGGRG